MDLLKVMSAMRKHRVLMTVGVAAGVFLSVVVAYRVSVDRSQDSPRLRFVERSRTVYETDVQLLITEPKYGVGRAGMIMGEIDGFDKTIRMAPTYARIITSDAVLQTVRSQIGPIDAEIESEALQDSPIVHVTVRGSNGGHVTRVAKALSASFISFLSAQQRTYKVPDRDRLIVNVLASPGEPTVTKSRAAEVAFLAFLAPVLGMLGLAILMEKAALDNEGD